MTEGQKRILQNMVLDMIRGERNQQDEEWGDQDHTLEHWHLILSQETGEVSKTVCNMTVPPVSEEDLDTDLEGKLIGELIQVGAVCVAWLEKLMKYDGEALPPLNEKEQAALDSLGPDFMTDLLARKPQTQADGEPAAPPRLGFD